jgi:hypothetical protein
MTDLRTSEISGLFTRWLERRSPPAQIRENERAQQDEALSLIGAILRFAPHSGYSEFTVKALDQIECEMRARAWPTKGELVDVCATLRREIDARRTDLSAGDRDMSPAAIAARKMLAGEPVGEGWLYGTDACELISKRLIDEATMRRYRSGAYAARRAIFGDDAAQSWLLDREAAHEAAKAARRAKDDVRYHRDVTVPALGSSRHHAPTE